MARRSLGRGLLFAALVAMLFAVVETVPLIPDAFESYEQQDCRLVRNPDMNDRFNEALRLLCERRNESIGPEQAAETRSEARSEIVSIWFRTATIMAVLGLAWWIFARKPESVEAFAEREPSRPNEDSAMAEPNSAVGPDAQLSLGAARLRELAALHSEGLLTAEEYEAKRRSIVESM